ncbi:MAG: ribbon-helix-helix domain-containing protein [Alphaproteobacteria bacterium]
MYDNILKTTKSSLVSRNITVSGRRTSIRLEREMWQSLHDISAREKCTVHNICTLVDLRKRPATTLTAAIRVFIMLYFRAASTKEGHVRAGHGDFEFMKQRAGVVSDAALFAKQKTQDILRQAS